MAVEGNENRSNISSIVQAAIAHHGATHEALIPFTGEI